MLRLTFCLLLSIEASNITLEIKGERSSGLYTAVVSSAVYVVTTGAALIGLFIYRRHTGTAVQQAWCQREGLKCPESRASFTAMSHNDASTR